MPTSKASKACTDLKDSSHPLAQTTRHGLLCEKTVRPSCLPGQCGSDCYTARPDETTPTLTSVGELSINIQYHRYQTPHAVAVAVAVAGGVGVGVVVVVGGGVGGVVVVLVAVAGVVVVVAAAATRSTAPDLISAENPRGTKLEM